MTQQNHKESSTMENTQNPSQFIVKYLNIAYHLGISTYRTKFDKSVGKYILVQNKFQKFFCILLCFGSLLLIISEFRLETLPSLGDPNPNPLVYFKLAHFFSEIVLFSITIYTQWSTSVKMLNLINFIYESPSYAKFSSYYKTKIWPPLIMSTLLIYIPTILHGQFSSEPSIFSRNVVKRGASLLFLENLEVIYESDFCRIFFSIFRITLVLSYIIFSSTSEYFLLHLAFVLNECLNDFKDSVLTEGNNVQRVRRDFETLTKVSELINNAVGLMTFGLVLGLLPYFVSSFVEFINPKDFIFFLYKLVEFTNIYGFMFLAANISRKASMVADIFVHNYDLSDLKPFEIQLLFYKISGHFVGFSGANFFIVTCGFLGSMLSLLLTFSVILIQFKLPTSNNGTAPVIIPPPVL